MELRNIFIAVTLFIFFQLTSSEACRSQLKRLHLDEYKTLAKIPGGLQDYLAHHEEIDLKMQSLKCKVPFCFDFVCREKPDVIYIGSGCFDHFYSLCQRYSYIDYEYKIKEAFKTAPTFQDDTRGVFIFACRDGVNCDAYRSDQDGAADMIPMVQQLVRQFPNLSREDYDIVPLPRLTTTNFVKASTATSSSTVSITEASSTTILPKIIRKDFHIVNVEIKNASLSIPGTMPSLEPNDAIDTSNVTNVIAGIFLISILSSLILASLF